MIRSMMVAAAALLVAGVAGLMTADAQPGKTAKLADVKKVEEVQKEFNATMDALLNVAKRRAGSATKANKVGAFAIDQRVYKTFVDKKFIVWQKGGLNLDQLVKMQKDVNVRFNALKKAGQLTNLDKKFLSEPTLDGMVKQLR